MAKKFYFSKEKNTVLPIPEHLQGKYGKNISAAAFREAEEAPAAPAPKKRGLNASLYDELDEVAVVSNITPTAEKKPKAGADSQKQTASKTRKQSAPTFVGVLRTLAFVVFFVALAFLCENLYQYIRDNEANKNAQQMIQADETETAGRETPPYPTDESGSNSQYKYPRITSAAKLKKFQSEYKDFSFWLYIQGAGISLPVLQSDDNDYYLRRNYKGVTNLSGTLFLDFRCPKDISTGHNIVYGHNMQNGTMFGGLKKYREKTFYDKHPYFYTYTTEEVTVWKVFSVYETTTDNYYIETYFKTDDEYVKFIQDFQKASLFKSSEKLDKDSVVLTLSTCHKYNYNNGRLVMHAVKQYSLPLE